MARHPLSSTRNVQPVPSTTVFRSWTVVGVDAGSDQGLSGEDGAVEVSRGGFRIEPFVVHGDELASWADVEISQSLQDGYLPIPDVAWKHPAFGLHVTAFAHGDAEQAQLVARYRLENTTDRPRAYTLALAIRPLPVNPPTPFDRKSTRLNSRP